MTPKEKAEELVDKFYQYLPIERDVTTSEGELSWKYDGWENAKQCALIAVDELIKSSPQKPRSYTDTMLYWEEVKQEISNI